MGRRRVVVTGVGAVTAAGQGVEPFWRACVEGRSMLRAVTRFDVSDLGSPLAGEIPGETLAAVLAGAREREVALDRQYGVEPAAALALAAAHESMAGAGLAPHPLDDSPGVVLGTCLGGAHAAFAWIDADLHGTDRRGHAPVSSAGYAAPAQELARAFGLGGPVLTVSTACASGTAAVDVAAECIRRGEAELMLAGGVDFLSRFVVAGFWLLRALASSAVRPFDRRRDGMALGEGAGILVLEERERAIRRGAPLLAEILGGGSAGDANHMTGPSPNGDGVVRATSAALRAAGCRADDVDFVSAHGTATRFNDRMETIAFKRIFGSAAYRIPVNSVKPIVGHTLGAAGALEAILCVRVLGAGIIPPTIHCEEPDPECDLDYVPGQARRRAVRCALSSSSAFAGNNAALLLGAP